MNQQQHYSYLWFNFYIVCFLSSRFQQKIEDHTWLSSCATSVSYCCANNELWRATASEWRMARLRRKSFITLIALVLLLLVVVLILKTLTPEDSPSSDSGGIELFKERKNHPEMQEDKNDKQDQTKIIHPALIEKDPELESILRKLPPPNYYLHAFYYIWFGNPKFDGKYIHWDHLQLPHWDSKVAQGFPQGRHSPPDDIGSNFYPSLGAYSSKDPSVLQAHMQQLRTAAIGKSRVHLNVSTSNESNHLLSNPFKTQYPKSVCSFSLFTYKFQVRVPFWYFKFPFKNKTKTILLNYFQFIKIFLVMFCLSWQTRLKNSEEEISLTKFLWTGNFSP